MNRAQAKVDLINQCTRREQEGSWREKGERREPVLFGLLENQLSLKSKHFIMG